MNKLTRPETFFIIAMRTDRKLTKAECAKVELDIASRIQGYSMTCPSYLKTACVTVCHCPNSAKKKLNNISKRLRGAT